MSEKTDYLKTILGEDEANALLKDIEETQQNLEQAGVESKESENDETKLAEEKETKPAEAPSAEALVAAVAKEVTKLVSEELQLDELSEWVVNVDKTLSALPTLAKAVSEIQKDGDDRLADIIESPVSKTQYAWAGVSQSKSEENVVDEKDDADLKKLTVENKDDWLSSLAGATPLVDGNKHLQGGIHYDA